MTELKEKQLKIILTLIIFLFLDLLKPFNYFLYTEFLFLGIILLSFNYSFTISFVLSAVFGYLKDSLTFMNIPLNSIEFALIPIFIHYVLSRFNNRNAKILVFLMVIISHIIFNTFIIGLFNFLFPVLFFIHSILSYLFINYLLKKWVKFLSVEYI